METAAISPWATPDPLLARRSARVPRISILPLPRLYYHTNRHTYFKHIHPRLDTLARKEKVKEKQRTVFSSPQLRALPLQFLW